MGGGKTEQRRMGVFSLDHAEEVHRESKEIDDPAWDCTLIKSAKDKSDILVNPIYYWTERDVVRYAYEQKVTMNPLYYMGYHRVGCIGCPMGSYKGRMKEFADFPKYELAYRKTCEAIFDINKQKIQKWSSPEDMFDWWVEDPNIKGQMNLEDFIGGVGNE